MPAICFYFQVHQPFRLRNFSYFEIGQGKSDYFDEAKNGEILRKVARKCYLPTNAKLKDLIDRHGGKFRVSFSITGTVIEQMRRYCPEALASFRALAKTGAVEVLCETSHHSLAALYDTAEFANQVERQRELVQEHFGQTPTVFRDTELIYDDAIGELAADLGFVGVLAEGADDLLAWRSPNFVYRHPRRALAVLLKNYRLSDDIAFRFSDRNWSEWPLSSERFSEWVHKISGTGDVVNLFMDYETFGEHQWAESGIFDFLDALPARILAKPDWGFATPSEVIARYPSVAEMPFHRTVSWADTERDLTAWRGNAMQDQALAEAYSLADAVRARNNPATTEVWRKLLTSDHFYYMCTKFFADGDVHMYFNPYASPYDAFINYMNVLSDFRDHVLTTPPQQAR